MSDAPQSPNHEGLLDVEEGRVEVVALPDEEVETAPLPRGALQVPRKMTPSR